MILHDHTWPSRHLFDVRIDALDTAQVLDAVDRAITERKRLLIGVVNAAKLVKMKADSALRRAVIGADLILADGMSIVWACRILRRPLPERVAGIDLMMDMLALADKRRYRVYCLGAKQDVLDEVVERIRTDYPNAIVAGARNGYFNEDEEAGIARQIADSKADMLFAAMTSPKKEMFLARWSPIMQVPVCHGVGGAFDVMSGKVKRAPVAWQNCGMEWLYRVLQEPGRMWRRYLTTNSLFVWMLGREAAKSAGKTRAGSLGRKRAKSKANW